MRLIGNINDYYTDESYEIARQKSVFYNRHDRTEAQHIKDILESEVLVEQVVANYFDCTIELNRSEWDLNGRDGQKHEVKMYRSNDKWWNLPEKRYKWFFQHNHMLNSIINVYLDDKGDVYLKHVANSKTFKNYINKSRSGGNDYYNIFTAEKDNECVNY